MALLSTQDAQIVWDYGTHLPGPGSFICMCSQSYNVLPARGDASIPAPTRVERSVRTSVLDLCLTAIDEQFDPGNKTAVIRGEEHDGFSDFVRIAQPPQRDGGRA